MATITVRDETAGGEVTHELTLSFVKLVPLVGG